MDGRIDGRTLSHEVLETYRLRAIELKKMGKQVKEIAFFFGLNPASVSRWFKASEEWKRCSQKHKSNRKTSGINA